MLELISKSVPLAARWATHSWLRRLDVAERYRGGEVCRATFGRILGVVVSVVAVQYLQYSRTPHHPIYLVHAFGPATAGSDAPG